MSAAISFLRGIGGNDSGYTLEQILAWSDEDLEMEHNYIQWLFPTDTPSKFNPDAPVLKKRDILILRADPECQKNLLLGYERFLTFLGLERVDGADQSPSGHVLKFFRYDPELWEHLNHNWWRISRVLRCFNLLNRRAEMLELWNFVKELPHIDSNTLTLWTEQVGDLSPGE